MIASPSWYSYLRLVGLNTPEDRLPRPLSSRAWLAFHMRECLLSSRKKIDSVSKTCRAIVIAIQCYPYHTGEQKHTNADIIESFIS
jgi:hypothetical protein